VVPWACPRGSDHQVLVLALGVTCDGTAELVANTLALKRPQKSTVFPREHVRMSGNLAFAFLTWSADNHVRATVVIDVASAGNVTSKDFAGIYGTERLQYPAIPPRVDECDT
jgi:hypothetical protein